MAFNKIFSKVLVSHTWKEQYVYFFFSVFNAPPTPPNGSFMCPEYIGDFPSFTIYHMKTAFLPFHSPNTLIQQTINHIGCVVHRRHHCISTSEFCSYRSTWPILYLPVFFFSFFFFHHCHPGIPFPPSPASYVLFSPKCNWSTVLVLCQIQKGTEYGFFLHRICIWELVTEGLLWWFSG